MSGTRVCLVDKISATSCLPPAISTYTHPIHRPHSELVKFSHRDVEYDKAAHFIKRIAVSLANSAQSAPETDNTESMNIIGVL